MRNANVRNNLNDVPVPFAVVVFLNSLMTDEPTSSIANNLNLYLISCFCKRLYIETDFKIWAADLKQYSY